MITSVRNQQIQKTRKLLKRGLRDKQRMFLVEGVRGVGEALASEARIDSLFVTPSASSRAGDMVIIAKRRSVPVYEVSDPVMRSISDATTPPGAVAVARFVDRDAESVLAGRPGMTVVLDGVRDPGNLGTILRTCWASGADAVFLGPSTVDVYNPKVVRAAAGAVFNLAMARGVDLPWLLGRLGDAGVRRISADARGEDIYHDIDLSSACALVFGGEAEGSGHEVTANVDRSARIPMPGGAESLNVAIAAAIFLFEAARQRAGGGKR